MSWTPERTEVCAKLWREGASASIIADRLGGITRNAVIGKVHRMGLMAKRSIKQGERTDLRGRKTKRNDVNGGGIVAAMRARKADEKARAERAKRKPPQPSAEPSEPKRAPVRFLELSRGMCKWPMDSTWGAEMMCCGAEVIPDEPYCAAHKERAYSGKVVAGTKPSRSRP